MIKNKNLNKFLTKDLKKKIIHDNLLTTKQLAQQLKVSVDVITNCVNRIMPKKMIKGKTTYFNELETSIILKELKSNVKVSEQLTSEAGSQVEKTTTQVLEIQEAQQKSLEGVEAIKKLSLQDQYRLSTQIQQNILNQLGEQCNLLMEQNNKILKLNEELTKKNESLIEKENERLKVYEEKYNSEKLKKSISDYIRKKCYSCKLNYKEEWVKYYKLYDAVHSFEYRSSYNGYLSVIEKRHHLKEFYELVLNK